MRSVAPHQDVRRFGRFQHQTHKPDHELVSSGSGRALEILVKPRARSKDLNSRRNRNETRRPLGWIQVHVDESRRDPSMTQARHEERDRAAVSDGVRGVRMPKRMGRNLSVEGLFTGVGDESPGLPR